MSIQGMNHWNYTNFSFLGLYQIMPIDRGKLQVN